MRSQGNAFKVGLVTLAAAIGFFVILLWISQRVSGELQTVTVRFKSSPSMPTLGPGSAVLVGGQKVGQITAAELRAETGPHGKERNGVEYFVYVDAEILATLELKTDCKVIAEGPPLGGDGLMKIDVGRAREKLPAGTVIEGAEPAGFAAILASMQGELNGDDPSSLLGQIKGQLDAGSEGSLMAKLLKSFSDVNEMTAALNKQLQPEERASLMAKLHDVADHINEATGSLKAELEAQRREALLAKVHQAMDSVNRSLTSLTNLLTTNEGTITQSLKNVERTTENIARETDASSPDSLMAQLKKTGAQLDRTIADISEITGTARDVALLNRENINRMLINFKESSDHLKSGLKFVLRHPWRLLNAPDQAQTRQEAIFDAARNFADAATQVDDAALQLRALADLHGGQIPADSPDLARIESDLRATREKYRKAEEELWEQLRIE